MRSIFKAAVLCAALLFDTASVAAQDVPAVTPDQPIPYTTLRPKAPRRPARPAAAPAAVAAPFAAADPATEFAGESFDAEPVAPVTAGARLRPGEAIPAAELEAYVDGVVRSAMSTEHIAGVTVSVVQNGQLVLKKGYGFASLSPQKVVDPDRTLFRIGSISKTFTWISLMKQVEAGRMSLDRPINLYLPERVQVRDQGYQTPVAVKNLMDHSAGFEDRSLGHLMERDFARVRPMETYLRQERPRRVFGAGKVSSYSNYGAALAGEAVSYVSGRPFETAIEQDILRPLGMSRTTFREVHPVREGIADPMPAPLRSGVADGFRWTPAGFVARPYEFIGQVAPAGSASSTAGDMSRYMLMLLGDGRLGDATIYGPNTAQAFRTPLRATARGVNGWAHGFQVLNLPGDVRGYGHGGATLSFMSNMVVAPELGLGIFISTNTETGQPLVARFPAEIVRRFYATPVAFPRDGSQDLAAARSGFAGYYLTTRRARGGLEGFIDRLTSGAVLDVTREGRLMVSGGGRNLAYTLDGDVEGGKFIEAQGTSRLAFAMSGRNALAFQDASGTGLFQRAPMWAQPRILGLAAALTVFAAVATLIGLAVRDRRELRQSGMQRRASLWQAIQAVLWLTSTGLFAVWASRAADIAQVMYRWPGAMLVTASACALVAALLTLATLIALPAVWQGGRRVESWSPLRKLFFTATVAIYASFSVLLGLWGALAPWSA